MAGDGLLKAETCAAAEFVPPQHNLYSTDTIVSFIILFFM
jgi:hypothetical protein